MLGGDVAGKALVPITIEPDARYSFALQGQREVVTEDELAAASKRLNFNGFYPRVSAPEEVDRMAEDPDYVASLFAEMITRQLTDWCEIAAERLPDNVRCIITPGNDDPTAIDDVLARATKVECPERKAVEVGPIWLASLGNTNRTPWDTDREFDEQELSEQIDAMLDSMDDQAPVVFNFHCPPIRDRLGHRPKARRRSAAGARPRPAR